LSRDPQFFDPLSLTISIVAAIALAIIIVLAKMSDLPASVQAGDADDYQAAVAERIRPLGQVYLPGDEQQASAPIVETAAEPEPVAVTLTGPQIYNDACIACHGTGVGGAPVVGDAAAWEARIAQGTDALNDHAINGIGVMPPKGGRLDLSDQEVIDAVAYMLGEVM